MTFPAWRALLSKATAAFFVLVFVGQLVKWETERIWFEAEGYQDIFATYTEWRLGSFALAAGIFALSLVVTARVAWRTAAQSHAPIGWSSAPGTQGRLIPLEDKLGMDRYRGRASFIYISILSGAAGLASATRFDLWLHAWHAPHVGQTDDIWNLDFSYYYWHLPALEAASGFVTVALWACLALAIGIYIYEEALELGGRKVALASGAARHLGLLVASLVAWQGVHYHLALMDLQSAHAGFRVEGAPNFGPGQALSVPLLTALCYLAFMVAGLVYLLFRCRRGRWACGIAVLFGTVGWLASALAPIWARSGVPGEATAGGVNGKGHTTLHMQATQEAWGLQGVTPYAGDQPGSAPLTPLWPPAVVEEEIRRRLKIRNQGLVLANLQLERWRVNSQTRLVYVAICQYLNTGTDVGRSGPVAAGSTAAFYVMDAVQTGPGGVPVFYVEPGKKTLHNLRPADKGQPALQIKPEALQLNFGLWPPQPDGSQFQAPLPGRSGAVPSQNGGTPQRGDLPLPRKLDLFVLPASEWKGEYGVPTENRWRRLLLAGRFLDPGMLFEGPQNVLWHRRVTERCRQLAPFLDWTHAEPRLLLTNADPVWVLTGLVWSRRYPNAAPAPSFSGNNYVRAVTTAVVNSRTGKTTFYLQDEREPFSRLYQRALPGLFQPASALPADLKGQVRASTTIFAGQSEIWSIYGSQLGAKQVRDAAHSSWAVALQAIDAPNRFLALKGALRRVLTPDASYQVAVMGQRITPATIIEEEPPMSVQSVLLSQDLGGGTTQLQEWRPSGPVPVDATLARESPVRVMLGRAISPPPTLISMFPVAGHLWVARGSREPRSGFVSRAAQTQPGGNPMAPNPQTETAGPGEIPRLRTIIRRFGLDGTALRQPQPNSPRSGETDSETRFWKDAFRAAKEAQQRGDWQNFERSWQKMSELLEPQASNAN